MSPELFIQGLREEGDDVVLCGGHGIAFESGELFSIIDKNVSDGFLFFLTATHSTPLTRVHPGPRLVGRNCLRSLG